MSKRPEKLRRDESTPEKKEFWDGVRKSAEGVKDWPDWKRAGINVNPQHFETYGPVDKEESVQDRERAQRFISEMVGYGARFEDELLKLMSEARRDAVIEERRRALEMGQPPPCPNFSSR